MKRPRPYQIEAEQAMRAAFRRKLRRIIIELATGLGKTVIFVFFTLMARAKGGRVLIVVNRDILITQAIIELAANGIFARREQAGDRAPITADVVVGSVQSMQGRWLHKWHPDTFRAVICDECHGSSATTFKAILEHFKNAFHLGVTATAERHDKKGLWSGYEDIVYRMPLRTWTDPETGTVTPGGQNEGWLANFRFEELPVPITLDDDVAMGKGELSEEAEYEQFNKENYLDKLFYEASEAVRGTKGLAFLPGCSASKECAEQMRKRGINAQHIDGYLPPKEQARILQWFKNEKTAMLCNADMLSVGYNQPDIDLVAMMRISRSTPMYKQRLGRGSRVVCDVDSVETASERLAMIAQSSKPFCRVIDLMIQNKDHNLVTPSCLITDDPEELKALNEARRSGGKPPSMDQMDETLGKFRVEHTDKQLAKLATDAANASLKVDAPEPYYAHILRKETKPSWKDASDAQIRLLTSLGYKGPKELKVYQASQIIGIFKEHAAKRK